VAKIIIKKWFEYIACHGFPLPTFYYCNECYAILDEEILYLSPHNSDCSYKTPRYLIDWYGKQSERG